MTNKQAGDFEKTKSQFRVSLAKPYGCFDLS